MNCPGGMGAWMGLWGLISLALLVLLILLIIWLSRTMFASSRSRGEQLPRPADDTLDILRRRYAAGEIDDEEFHRRRNNLREH